MALTLLNIPELLVSASDLVRRTGSVSTWHRQAIYAALGDTNTRVAIAPEAYNDADWVKAEVDEGQRGGMPLYRFQTVFGAQRALGHIRRSWLAILTSEHLAPIWGQEWHLAPTLKQGWHSGWKHEDHAIICAFFRDVFFEARQDRNPMNRRWILPDDVRCGADAVMALTQPVYAVLTKDKDFLLDPLPPVVEDAHILSFNWDVPFWAARASYPNQRAFWMRWLEEAIPAVLAAYPNPEHFSAG